MTVTPGWLATSLGTFRVVARHGAIGRMVVAHDDWAFEDWAGWTAILVDPAQFGGAPAAGVRDRLGEAARGPATD